MSNEQEFKYFSCVEGRVVTRFGHPDIYIGVKHSKDGWAWDTKEIVAIPTAEVSRYYREYKKQVKNGSLKDRTKKEHSEYLKDLEKQEEERLAAVEKELNDNATETLVESDEETETKPAKKSKKSGKEKG